MSANVLEELQSPALGYPRTFTIKSLVEDRLYDIQSMKKVTTKYGVRVIVNLGEFQVFLPERYTAMSQETLDEINLGAWTLTYQGLWYRTVKLEIKPKL